MCIYIQVMLLHDMQAMFVSFGMAEHLNGECVLRFDDTNPEAEKQEYIDHIQDIVSWMGWTPSKVQSPPPPAPSPTKPPNHPITLPLSASPPSLHSLFLPLPTPTPHACCSSSRPFFPPPFSLIPSQ